MAVQHIAPSELLVPPFDAKSRAVETVVLVVVALPDAAGDEQHPGGRLERPALRPSVEHVHDLGAARQLRLRQLHPSEVPARDLPLIQHSFGKTGRHKRPVFLSGG